MPEIHPYHRSHSLPNLHDLPFKKGEAPPHLRTPEGDMPEAVAKQEQASPVSDAPIKKPSLLKRIIAKIWQVVKKIFSFIIGCALFISTPTFFAIGFIAGIVFKAKVQEAISRIRGVWKSQKWGTALLVVMAGFLALPVTLAGASLLYSGRLGARLSKENIQE